MVRCIISMCSIFFFSSHPFPFLFNLTAVKKAFTAWNNHFQGKQLQVYLINFNGHFIIDENIVHVLFKRIYNFFGSTESRDCNMAVVH